MSGVLETIAQRVGAVSPAWRDELGGQAAPATVVSDRLPTLLRPGVESIREGFLLHYGTPRVVSADIDPSLRLLMGDYCYAQGLCSIAETGDVRAVRVLAELIADIAANTNDGDSTVARQHEERWRRALKELES